MQEASFHACAMGKHGVSAKGLPAPQLSMSVYVYYTLVTY